MRFVIVTGMSGAGKSSVLKMLEDAGYFCVDNLPIQLISNFVKLIFAEKQQDVALGLDVRSGEALKELDEVLYAMNQAKL
ncbi:MAG TPA: RNase adaptor protein RapZ, partial [Lachnospiraceae bacterium]|nr:RNase adaptor protein RapZ [Lachnospiraceae bacterium]